MQLGDGHGSIGLLQARFFSAETGAKSGILAGGPPLPLRLPTGGGLGGPAGRGPASQDYAKKAQVDGRRRLARLLL